MFEFEHHTQPLLPRTLFMLRICKSLLIALAFAGISLFVGVLGYHYLEDLSWIDALLNASMIMGGMGPVDILHTDAGKLFASFYALYSGLLLIGLTGILLSSFVHRILHSFHASAPSREDD